MRLHASPNGSVFRRPICDGVHTDCSVCSISESILQGNESIPELPRLIKSRHWESKIHEKNLDDLTACAKQDKNTDLIHDSMTVQHNESRRPVLIDKAHDDAIFWGERGDGLKKVWKHGFRGRIECSDIPGLLISTQGYRFCVACYEVQLHLQPIYKVQL